MTTTSKAPPLNLSFSGCGFLGLYHVGVICAFKEQVPEILQNKMAGCSAGALAAACAMCNCCEGQMCSDVLEIAIRARSHALGPFHPTFSIVDIIRNGLRRILPPNAHEICSGRLFISLTKWNDKKNVLISEYATREELIQVLICSSFVPLWSGVLPPKFRDEYYWDGGLTNNTPILDESTITVSPFAGESDICPRGESGSFYSVDFRGTDVSLTQENLSRLTRALFPPNISVLKQICWHGYVDGFKFLQTRNLTQLSHIYSERSFSSFLGNDYSEPAIEEENELANGGIAQNIDRMYETLDEIDEESTSEDDEDYESDSESNGDTNSQMTYSPFCEKVTPKKELPTSLFAVFADARRQEEDPLRRYFTQSRWYRLGRLMALPVTLPVDMTLATTKRVLGVFRPTTDNSNASLPTRAANYLWSFFVDEEAEKKSCYHVNDCVCTDSRHGSTMGMNRSHVRRTRHHRHRRSRLNHPEMSTTTTTTQSDSVTDDDHDTLSISHDECLKGNPEILSNNLPKPDLIASISKSDTKGPFYTRNQSIPTNDFEKNLQCHS